MPSRAAPFSLWRNRNAAGKRSDIVFRKSDRCVLGDWAALRRNRRAPLPRWFHPSRVHPRRGDPASLNNWEAPAGNAQILFSGNPIGASLFKSNLSHEAGGNSIPPRAPANQSHARRFFLSLPVHSPKTPKSDSQKIISKNSRSSVFSNCYCGTLTQKISQKKKAAG